MLEIEKLLARSTRRTFMRTYFCTAHTLTIQQRTFYVLLFSDCSRAFAIVALNLDEIMSVLKPNKVFIFQFISSFASLKRRRTAPSAARVPQRDPLPAGLLVSVHLPHVRGVAQRRERNLLPKLHAREEINYVVNTRQHKRIVGVCLC